MIKWRKTTGALSSLDVLFCQEVNSRRRPGLSFFFFFFFFNSQLNVIVFVLLLYTISMIA